MKVSKSGYNVTPLTQAQRDELASKVDANTRHIALESGTERAFTGKTVNGEASLSRHAFIILVPDTPNVQASSGFLG